MQQINVLGSELQPCSLDPVTGYYRTGCCENHGDDPGMHVVCCRVDEAFLEFSVSHGNDLVTPMPEYGFAGLKPGDQWCVCAARWAEALESGQACPVVLESTHVSALEYVDLDDLKSHARSISQVFRAARRLVGVSLGLIFGQACSMSPGSSIRNAERTTPM